ncbi:MAG TPA: hypothetical protein VGL71_02520 [Urbifossiella sp.]
MTPNLVLLLSGIIGIASTAAIAADSTPVLEVAPPPRIPFAPVAIQAVKGGYQVFLNRAAAEMLSDALYGAEEKEITASLRQMAKDKKNAAKNSDDQTAATLEMIAFVVSSQLPGFKKALAENMGPHGAVITLTGLQAPVVKFAKPRPRLEKALETVRGVMPLLPDEAQDAVEAIRAVARTTPLFWKVEPRE